MKYVAQFIRQTATAFRLRFNDHKAHIKTMLSFSVSRHFSQPGHYVTSSSLYRILHILETGFKSKDRETCESYLIHKFKWAVDED